MYNLVQKAYEIDFSRVNEGYLYGQVICHADTLNQAKSILLKRNNDQCLNISLRCSEDDITYITIPVIRCKESDWYEFENERKTLYQIQQILNERERIKELDEILNNGTIKYCYIKKRGEYYRPNSCGYTSYRMFAGVYSKEEAVSDAKSCNELTIIPIDINEHNKFINEVIADLNSKLL